MSWSCFGAASPVLHENLQYGSYGSQKRGRDLQKSVLYLDMISRG